MELTESIESINNHLRETFGVDTVTGQVMYRVVWSEDQTETQYGTFRDYTDSGLFIREVTEARVVKKYFGYTKERYILERLVAVPNVNLVELCGTKMSYEPIWTFMDMHTNYLPPTFEACELIINTLHAALGKSDLSKYAHLNEDGPDQLTAIENKRKRVEQLVTELFGEESSLCGTSLNSGSTAFVPNNYESDKKEKRH